MPKATKTDANRRVYKVSAKFKIGGRKSTKSALETPTVELLALIGSPRRKRDLPKIRQVLNMRGVDFAAALADNSDTAADVAK